ncbi:MAG: type II toxin-antitoxin system PemK/MazF family toxin [Rhodoferax sp.]|uniref:type II toxin-antitoxin system PemK/MazF family toxin n=1 Tax=Rhodoferax sp. TaxID=50421 RepID=UPI0008AC4851|nr:type II toxin-antitoxin system PemK/MazF family toxin [Rhodoferax sp.]MDP2681158.1 type II toxin-antitoxin system PemK/MazF family toxin [Rhodoferax sp.]OGB55706.1 MAG: hypothetical protein A2503_11730 [Burkholderiales bacterium RIFOXYD12_FULL_59_19]OGB76372.1 MAG: hypothetical protein A2496_08595 [Burkholderiales bacterium RIFOXYC12_FULL_60_6]OGB87611.1 MAG: hypothetical protein A2535_08520 [Burkholderiales bacterium RIFOXYD2_FULL_59_8]
MDPTRGSEIVKTRPVLVVSPDAMNQRVESVVVCPLTSQLHPLWASRVACDCDGLPSEVAVDQICTISKSRLGKTLGKLDAATAAEVRAVIRLLYAEN